MFIMQTKTEFLLTCVIKYSYFCGWLQPYILLDSGDYYTCVIYYSQGR